MLTPVILGSGAASLSITAATKVLEELSAVEVALALLNEMASGVPDPEALALALAMAAAAAMELEADAEDARLEATAAAFIDEEGAAVREAAATEEDEADWRAGTGSREVADGAGAPETSSTPIELALWAALSLVVELEEAVSAAKTVTVRVIVVVTAEEADVEF